MTTKKQKTLICKQSMTAFGENIVIYCLQVRFIFWSIIHIKEFHRRILISASALQLKICDF